MNTPRPRKHLPVNPSLEHLQKQAERRAKESPSLEPTAAQDELAREFGCENWSELARRVEEMSRRNDQSEKSDPRFAEMPKAARARNFERVKQLLEEGTFTPHTLDQSFAHVLWYGTPATWPERKAAADLFLEYGADPNGQYGSGGYGPLVFGTGECVQPEGLLYLIEAGADVSFAPVQTKYGLQCPLSYILGTYSRGNNDRKHRYIEILLQHNPYIPTEVSPAVLAIHRGDPKQLGETIDCDPSLLNRTMADLPYGNIDLNGGTLLHCAVEFGENDCVEELLRRGADINARSETTSDIGGQSPIFHAIAPQRDGDVPTLKLLAKMAGPKIDMKIRARVRRFGELQPQAQTALEFAEQVLKSDSPESKAWADEELKLLRGLAGE